LFENIDSKVRAVTNFYVHVSKSNGYLNYYYYDVEQASFLRQDRLSLEKVAKIGEEIFDTYEMVTPLDYPKSRPEFELIMGEVKQLNKAYMEQIRNENAVVS
ncbi:TPA: hypothetical protein VJS26_001763, partial [Streptococcus pyogenes]|nr:hypothetical protein [Streptococcus pyogenes]